MPRPLQCVTASPPGHRQPAQRPRLSVSLRHAARCMLPPQCTRSGAASAFTSWVTAQQEGGGDLDGRFGHDAGNPLFIGNAGSEGSSPADAPPAALLVDETSMLDLSLAASLLDALPAGHPTQLVLVGAGLSLHVAS